jgi:diguanylate cyclase (GGDEF)-like protein
MTGWLAEHLLQRPGAAACLAAGGRPGTPAHVRIPGAAALPDGLPLAEPRAAQERPRILILEGDPNALVLAHILAQRCQIASAASADQLLASACCEPRPDVVLLDVTAPARDGLAICRRLKRDEATHGVAVMLITDRDSAEDEACALEAGADDCITRPFRLDVAEARVHRQISLRRRTEMLERYANHDSLTDLANRRSFDLTLDAEWRRGIRDEHPLSLVMIDVDRFKQFNDRYGHREGDHCLRQVAKAMRRTLARPGDFLARYGGEEFAVILPDTDLDGARLMGERLRSAVMELDIPRQRADNTRQVTISAGCASTRPSASLTCYSLLQAADDKLYVAKHSGRNCVR